MRAIAASLFALALATGTGATAADSDQPARIVVMRVQQGMGANYPADVFEVLNGKPQYAGRLWQGEKLVLRAAPGKNQYMTMGFGHKGEFFFTDPLLPGKTYYVMLRYHPASGAMTPIPVRPGSAFPPDNGQVKAAMSDYKTVVLRQASIDAFNKSRGPAALPGEFERISGLYARKTAAEIGERTVHAEDTADGGARPAPSASTSSAPSAASATRRLEELKSLHDRGLITNEEYDEKRKAILKDL